MDPAELIPLVRKFVDCRMYYMASMENYDLRAMTQSIVEIKSWLAAWDAQEHVRAGEYPGAAILPTDGEPNAAMLEQLQRIADSRASANEGGGE